MQLNFLKDISKHDADLPVKKNYARLCLTKRTSFIFLFLFFFQQTFSQSINTKKLDSLFDILDSNHLAMGSVVIAKNNKTIYQRQIGYSYIDSNKKIFANAGTKYRIGSITKMFTAVIIFQLIEEGKLSLNTKLAKFYPQIPNVGKITIEMLLRHRSGLIDYVNDSVSTNPLWLTKPQANQTILQKIINGKPHFSPDSKTRYCNSGYWLLAKIIEKIERKSYDKILVKRIIHKIHLGNLNTDSVANKNEALAYLRVNDSLKFKQDFYFNNVEGVGNIFSAPTDLIKFMQALFDYKLIKKSSLDSMLDFPKSKDFNIYGMGIIKVPYGDKSGYGHSGGTYGQFSHLYNFTKDSLIIAQSFNNIEVPLNDVLVSELNICYNHPENFSEYKITIYPVTEKELNKYIGIYSSKLLPQKFVITKQGNQLYAQLGNQPNLPIQAIAKDKFEFKAVGATFIFNPDKEELALHQNGEEILFTKDK